MPDFQCIVFDMDDTLYLERQYVWSGFTAVAKHLLLRYPAKHFAEAAWGEFLNGRRGDIFNHALAKCSIQPRAELVSELVEIYRTHVPQISLLPDSIECLNTLKKNCRLGLLSDGPLACQRAKAHALNLSSWMDVTVFTAELGPEFGKPHQAGFKFIEQAFQCSGCDCTYVGDNPLKDFVAPHAMGWRAIRIRRKDGLHENVQSGSDVDEEIESLCEL